MRQCRFQVAGSVECRHQLQGLGPVEEDRRGARRQVLESHDAGDGGDVGPGAGGGDGGRDRREGAVDVGVAEGDEGHFLARVEVPHDGGGGVAVRRQAVAGDAGHVEDEPFHRHFGSNLTDDRLGSAHGIGGERRGDDPVGVVQGAQRLEGDRLGVAGTHADAHEESRWPLGGGGARRLFGVVSRRRHGSHLRVWRLWPSFVLRSADAGGAELDADPRPDGARRLRDRMFPGALAAPAHDQQVAVPEVEAQAASGAATAQQ